MIEAALVFDREGRTLFWHLPPGRSAGSIPDTQDLWEVLWENRDRLGGVAHTHPWEGDALPSQTDVTTFAAVEAGLGRRLQWWVVTFNDAGCFKWVWCRGRNGYRRIIDPPVRVEDVDKLRWISKEGDGDG